jgi:hypothetical protein
LLLTVNSSPVSEMDIPVYGFDTGIYFLQILDGTKAHNCKLIVK